MEREMCSPLIADLKSVVTCQVCFQRMDKPKALSCLHSFCQMCIADMLPVRCGLLSCPICRENTVVPENDPRILPTAFFINQILDILVKHETKINHKGKGAEHAKVTNSNRDDEVRWRDGVDTILEKPVTFEGIKKAMPARYNVKIEKASICSNKEHVFVAKEFKKEYRAGDVIKLKLWKICGNSTTPCCAWVDTVDCTMVDNIGRVSKFNNTRISDGGWELSCKADRTGVFRVIIKVNDKPVETIELEVKSAERETATI